ncbi:MAG: cbb3-type cytochrome oxidase assembly protein CcoS [Leadbetterella sp.]|nr:cbb3-type cytochrome oxidase assembly protein CcoS [Leadbetterella sp.]
MSVIIFLVVLVLIIAGGFLISFFWATKDGQFDDTYTPSVRILFDDEKEENPSSK